MPSVGEPEEWAQVSARLDDVCREVGRNPAEIRRSVQLFLHPAQAGQVDIQLARLAEFGALGCAHAVLSFYQPPTTAQLQRVAELI